MRGRGERFGRGGAVGVGVPLRDNWERRDDRDETNAGTDMGEHEEEEVKKDKEFDDEEDVEYDAEDENKNEGESSMRA